MTRKKIGVPSAGTAWLMISFLLFISIETLAGKYILEGNYPKVGHRCPEFYFERVNHFSKTQCRLEDFEGKWLVLDFFSSGCISCFRSLPKLNDMRKKYKDKFEIILVGQQDGKIENVYERFRNRFHLDLPITYDSAIFRSFGIVFVPRVIIVDPAGIVRAITSSFSESVLNELLDGKNPELLVAMNKEDILKREKRYDHMKPLLLDGNGGDDNDFLYRSILTTWKGDIFGLSLDFISNEKRFGNVPNRVQVIGVPLKRLYQYAYGDTVSELPSEKVNSYGKFASRPLLELSDTADFNYSYASAKNFYNYSLIVPEQKATAKYLQEIMRRDLQSYFGYNVTVESRLMPCWKLVPSKLSKKKETNGIVLSEYDISKGFTLVNEPMSRLITLLYAHFPQEPPFIDETGIQGNITVKVEAILTDFAEVKKSLQINGFDLIKGSKEMKVIVIRNKS